MTLQTSYLRLLVWVLGTPYRGICRLRLLLLLDVLSWLEVIFHMQDYMYNVVETAPLPDGRALWVLDLKGIPSSSTSTDTYSSSLYCCDGTKSIHSGVSELLSNSAITKWKASLLHWQVLYGSDNPTVIKVAINSLAVQVWE